MSEHSKHSAASHLRSKLPQAHCGCLGGRHAFAHPYGIVRHADGSETAYRPDFAERSYPTPTGD